MRSITLRPVFFFIFFGCSFVSLLSQSSIVVKAKVKDGKVLLRWMPSDLQLLDAGVRHGYKIIRTGGASSNPVMVAEKLKPFDKNDSLSWKKLFRKNPKAALAFKTMYERQSKAVGKQKQEQDLMLFSLLAFSCDFDTDIAGACGLFLMDSTAASMQTYTYKIQIDQAAPELKYKPAEISVSYSNESLLPAIGDLEGTFRNKTVRLKWKAGNYKSEFSGYNIERSDDSIHFATINKSPLVFLTTTHEKKKEYLFYNDTFPITGKKYFYRIRGISYFGELAAPSNVVSGSGHTALRSMPVIDSIRVLNNQHVFMRWRMQDSAETRLPKTYLLLKSKKDLGPYELVLNSIQLSYIDKQPGSPAYYKIAAITKGNDTLLSYSYLALIVDSIPPVPPQGLRATVDPKGNVLLSWTKNSEADLRGYKIFKANALNEEFVQINKTFATTASYMDQLNLKTLSKSIYYCVAATDRNYNNSGLSAPIQVKRPDTIPPVAPIITEVKLVQEGIRLTWIQSSSEDVRHYVLYRQQENTKADVKIKEWRVPDSLTVYTDTSATPGTGYRYRLLVSDEDDNISVSNSPYINNETGFRKKIKTLNGEADRVLKQVKLSWSCNEQEIEKYIIYRAKKDGPLSILKTLSAPAQQFSDKTPPIGHVYEYRIKAVYRNGAESVISDAVMVDY